MSTKTKVIHKEIEKFSKTNAMHQKDNNFSMKADAKNIVGANESPRIGRLSLVQATLLLPFLLAGCGNISGLIDAHDEFGCGVPGKANCATLSETYAAEHALDEARSRAMAQEALTERAVIAQEDLPHGEKEEQGHQKAIPNADSGAASKERAALAAGKVSGLVRETEGLTMSAAHALARAQGKKTDARMRALGDKPKHLPARAPEKVVMLWVLPWVDAQGDLHGDSRVWVRVKDALWRIERVRSRAMRSVPGGVEP